MVSALPHLEVTVACVFTVLPVRRQLEHSVHLYLHASLISLRIAVVLGHLGGVALLRLHAMLELAMKEINVIQRSKAFDERRKNCLVAI